MASVLAIVYHVTERGLPWYTSGGTMVNHLVTIVSVFMQSVKLLCLHECTIVYHCMCVSHISKKHNRMRLCLYAQFTRTTGQHIVYQGSQPCFPW